MKSNSPKDIFPNVQFIQVCPLCNTEYPKKNTRVVHGSSGSHIVHTTCGSCASSIMAVVTESPLGLRSMGIMTDMNYDDMIRFREEAPISVDDCLSLHVSLSARDLFTSVLPEKRIYDVSIERRAKNRKTGSRARRG